MLRASKSISVLALCVFLLGLVGVEAQAIDLSVPEGYEISWGELNVGGGFDYLSNGDILGFSADYINGPTLFLADGDGDGVPEAPEIITSFDSSVYAAFVEVSPLGSLAVFGVTGSINALYVLDLSDFSISKLVDVVGNYDVAFINEDTFYLSANEGFFNPSVPSRVYRLDIQNAEAMKLVAEISNTPAGPISLNSRGDLYYLKSTWVFPAPAGSHSLFRFDAGDLSEAYQDGPALNEADSEIAVPLDSGYDIAVNTYNPAGDEIFVSAFAGGILRLTEGSLVPDVFSAATNPLEDDSSYTYLNFHKSASNFSPLAPNGAKLGASISANWFTDYFLAEITPQSRDSDGDGAYDYDELAGGTDIEDPGSYPATLKSPVYSLWNGFLDMVNILELVNNGNSAVLVKLSLFKIDGSLGSEMSVALGSNQQLDVILNDLEGFSGDSYGLVKLEYEGTIDGRVSFYRSAKSGESYDFAFGVPLSNPTYGSSGASFNTFQPSLSPAESDNIVANWLSIVNLFSGARGFTVNKYDQAGTLLSSSWISVPALGRVDIEGGHEQPGPMHVGLMELVPDDVTSPYLSQLVRYGADGQGGYSFAFPLVSRAGNGRKMLALTSSEYSSQNWLEVVNTRGEPVRADVRCYDSEGGSLLEVGLSIGAYAQQHLNVSALLGSGQNGLCSVSPRVKNSIVAQSMFYARRGFDGSMLSMHGSQLGEALGQGLHGTYNLFLGMENKLRLLNSTSSSISVDVGVYGQSKLSDTTVVIPANGLVELLLHNSAEFGTSANTYGVLTVSSPSQQQVLAEMLRTRLLPGSDELDYSMPTAVR